MCEDFAPNFNDKRTGCCITTTYRLALPFPPGNFDPKEAWLSSPTHPNFLFPPFKTKRRGRHFDTDEVIEAESQAVLNAPTERDPQYAFKNGRRAGNGACTRNGTTSRVMVASRPKVSFRPEDSTSPGNYEYQWNTDLGKLGVLYCEVKQPGLCCLFMQISAVFSRI
jgi:hypothetical protein